jgi:hypothetical protein
VADRAQPWVVLERAEGLLHEDQLHVATPPQLRPLRAQAGAQEIPA